MNFYPTNKYSPAHKSVLSSCSLVRSPGQWGFRIDGENGTPIFCGEPAVKGKIFDLLSDVWYNAIKDTRDPNKNAVAVYQVYSGNYHGNMFYVGFVPTKPRIYVLVSNSAYVGLLETFKKAVEPGSSIHVYKFDQKNNLTPYYQ